MVYKTTKCDGSALRKRRLEARKERLYMIGTLIIALAITGLLYNGFGGL